MKPSLAALTLLAFGVISLVGLITLAGIGSLTDPVQTTLSSIAFGSLAAAAGVTIPHAVDPSPSPPPTGRR